MVVDGAQQAQILEILNDALAGYVTVEALIYPAVLVDVRGRIHDVDGRQVMALAEGEVVGIVGGGDLDRAGAEVAADPLVEDDGDLAIHERQQELFAMEMPVALVLGVDGYGYVA